MLMTIKRRTATHQRNMNEDMDWEKFYLTPIDFGKRSCEQFWSTFIIYNFSFKNCF